MQKHLFHIIQSIVCLKTAVKAKDLYDAVKMKSKSDSLKYVFFSRFCLALLLLSFSSEQSLAQLALKSQEVWPSVDAYYRINPKFRVYGTMGATKLDESSYTDGAIGVFLDYFTYPITNIFRPGHPDGLPGKFLWIRAGYQYSATPPSAEDPFKESMIVTEANARYYLPYKILFTWKNRFDWRIKNGEFNSRYRPKLMFEKDLHTATGFAEYYLNFGNSAVNRLRTQLGVEIKVLKHVNYEVFWNHQFSNQPEIQEVDAFGMTLKIYMDHNEVKDFIEKKKNKKKEKKEKKKNEAH
jgi:Protein of unknown function (DUF2490)